MRTPHVKSILKGMLRSLRLLTGLRKKGCLIVECDEIWSFVGQTGNKQWMWLALDRDTHRMVAVHVGSRDEAGSRALWASLPQMHRACARCNRDFWSACALVISPEQHKTISEAGDQTHHRGRFNATPCQCCRCWVCQTLSFAKEPDHHIRKL